MEPGYSLTGQAPWVSDVSMYSASFQHQFASYTGRCCASHRLLAGFAGDVCGGLGLLHVFLEVIISYQIGKPSIYAAALCINMYYYGISEC